ncbi:potassium channel family protein [Halocalculus aciditolerans]|uniref:Metal transporter n=1 Tax=Halocalculus aciditolerans TaxID=1383812 RepID=A0A830F3U6_9EURY|nr:NAD-binding protein [Halocalculus aciditolerans]GGL60602.1 metal transporter [Halocalculus aciditolerans]
MDRQQRRVAGYLALVAAVTVACTLAYAYGMATFEGRPRSLLYSLHVVVETFTTTGYGEDAGWQSAPMLVLMVVMQFTGILLVFLALPIFVVPWIERRLEVEPPTRVDVTDHVVICGFTPRGDTLVDELDAQGVDHVIVLDDEERARELHEAGRTVVAGDPEEERTLERACVDDARAVVLDGGDEANAIVALSVREVAPDVELVGFVQDPAGGRYIRLAGADRVLSPHVILGRSLADRVTSAITPDLGETVEIGSDFEIAEIPIQSDSELDGATLADAGIRERTGVNVIGAWFAGEFVAGPPPARELHRNTILLVAGSREALESLKRYTLADPRYDRDHGRVVVAGAGEVGSIVHESLERTDIDATLVDRVDGDDVDVVGDVTETETLEAADLGDADALILALGDDSSTVFSTLVAREFAADLDIICRANEAEAANRIYAAGADYVLTLSRVSGRMLAATLLGEDVMTLDTQVDIVRTDAPGFEGLTLAEADIRSRTGCTVVAVERDDDVHTDLGPDFRIRTGDALVVAGTDTDIATFNELAGVTPAPATD